MWLSYTSSYNQKQNIQGEMRRGEKGWGGVRRGEEGCGGVKRVGMGEEGEGEGGEETC